ncbi:N-6 DNA methylase [Nocardioides sp. SR21]|uniref:N-6 DNA methylase n=1 Tax=Nocardioides sp. SR21 TaxID=2919501 RepID=UPI001FAA664D|nr:N-6 DNA methylase [Nocardioides sp. SR21]
MLPGDSADLRKARGAFFTPEKVARFVTDWAVRSSADAVIEPSCGEAVFLHQISREHKGRIVGVEIHPASAREAERTLNRDGIRASVHTGDFFAHTEFGRFDAAVGNPPYVRYQGWTGEARKASLAAALGAGVNLTNLASSWAAFTVHSALHLRDGGRLGLVLPAELLTVNYAAPVRQFLMDHFGDVTLVLFEERVFPGIEVEAVLLLADGFDAEGHNGTDHMSLIQVGGAGDLTDLASARRWTPPARGARWSAGLMSSHGFAAYSSALGLDGIDVLEAWGDTTLGMVTGNNKFFTMGPGKVAALGLTDTDVVPLSPPGSRHLRSLTLTSIGLERLASQGEATYLFRPDGEPSRAAWRYIKSGEDLDVHTAYKCRVRSTWWRVPYLRPADLFLTYMNADTPRLATNRAKAHHLNSVHGVYLNAGVRELGRSLLPLASLNSVTLLGAEVVGRAYGGGMLKIEPREADRLPMPSSELVNAHRDTLRSLRPAVAASLRAGRLLDAVSLVDGVLLTGALGLSGRDLAAIRLDRANLASRRAVRGRGGSRGEG